MIGHDDEWPARVDLSLHVLEPEDPQPVPQLEHPVRELLKQHGHEPVVADAKNVRRGKPGECLPGQRARLLAPDGQEIMHHGTSEGGWDGI